MLLGSLVERSLQGGGGTYGFHPGPGETKDLWTQADDQLVKCRHHALSILISSISNVGVRGSGGDGNSEGGLLCLEPLLFLIP